MVRRRAANAARDDVWITTGAEILAHYEAETDAA
ncbi:hypothetical protein M2267_002637 [Ensifer sp. KUDG1]